ncbi:MAG: hypothetical protein KatS3mg031_1340 [Chitinophagales bacterium]|nr:MAG: hypothetical protein KatS3mg031_1340 [Chitinophagales bacterium]
MTLKRQKAHLYVFIIAVLSSMMGFFFSRTLLSISLGVLIGQAFLQGDLRARLQATWKEPLFYPMALVFFIAAFSGLWSADKVAWMQACFNKVPFLLLPFVFSRQAGLTEKYWAAMSLLWVALVLAGSVFTLVQFTVHYYALENMYQVSKVLPTWAAGSHIRFSMAVVVALLLCLRLEELESFSRSAKLLLRLIMMWLMLFLLILSAKTGWVGLFLVVIPALLYHLFHRGHRILVVALLAIALLLPVVSYYVLPTFRERVHYIRYELEHPEQKRAAGVYSDHNRLLSMQAGWDIFLRHPVRGVGYGDMYVATYAWFEAHAPQVPPSERFRPLNQWLNAAAASGIAGLIVVTLAALLPFFLRTWRGSSSAIALAFFMLLVFLYENPLEDQLGVFLYAFFMWWFHYSLRLEGVKHRQNDRQNLSIF